MRQNSKKCSLTTLNKKSGMEWQLDDVWFFFFSHIRMFPLCTVTENLYPHKNYITDHSTKKNADLLSLSVLLQK